MKKTVKNIAILLFIWIIIPDEDSSQIVLYDSFMSLEAKVRLLCGTDAPFSWATIEDDFNSLEEAYEDQLYKLSKEQLQSISLSRIIIEACLIEAKQKSSFSSHPKIIYYEVYH